MTGGNVSFYNETKGNAIYPTPVIGMLGVVEQAELAVGLAFQEGDEIVLLGSTDTDDFGGSEYAKVINQTIAGRPPKIDLEAELKLHRLLFELCRDRRLRSAHDLSEGGLAIAVAESALAGGVGSQVALPEGESHRVAFAESPSRVVVSCNPEHRDEVLRRAQAAGVPAVPIGRTGGSDLSFGTFEVSLDEARSVFESGFRDRIGAAG